MKKKEQIQKKVSIIMPTYNRGYIIKKAIHSVMRQTYPDWELIIVDDGSKDDTLDKVASFQDKRIVCFHYNENLGSNHARNVGIAMSKGKYIAFLDSDNQWDMSYLEKQIACLENPKNIQDIVFAKTEIVHTDFSVVFPKESGEKLKSSFGMIKSAMFGSIFDTNVVCMKKKVWKEAGGFCESLRRFQDWEFFMRLLLKKKYSFYFNDEILCHNYIQEDSIGFRNDLFWNARLYIFEEFIDVCRDMGLVVDVVLSMLEDVNIEFITPVQSERILSLMSGEEKTELFKIYQRYYNHYISSTKISEEYLSLAMKNHLILTLEGKWIAVTQRGGKVIDYFHRYKVRSICIYGFGVLGKLLWEELKNTDILVKIIIDEMITSDSVIIFKPNDVKVFLVDLIVVTVIGSFEEIRKNLEKKTAVKIISLNEVIETLYCNSMKSDIKDCFQ